jgi:hypothetical protein
MSTTATEKRIVWTFDEALHHARCYHVEGDPPIVRNVDVAQIMVDQGCCTWHACHVAYLQAVAAGRIAFDRCSRCGGRNEVGRGNHSMCDARARHGQTDFPVLDVVDARVCDCTPCRAARGESGRFF